MSVVLTKLDCTVGAGVSIRWSGLLPRSPAHFGVITVKKNSFYIFIYFFDYCSFDIRMCRSKINIFFFSFKTIRHSQQKNKYHCYYVLCSIKCLFWVWSTCIGYTSRNTIYCLLSVGIRRRISPSCTASFPRLDCQFLRNHKEEE